MAEMRRVTVRFGESLWDLIEEEANIDGVSAAQFIRDAALGRVVWSRARRGAEDNVDAAGLVRDTYRAEDEAFQRVVQDVLDHARPELETIVEKLPARSAREVRRWYGL